MLGSFGKSFSFGRRKPGALDIVRADLQLYLNAADSTSYPGAGTTWTDLSPNGYSTTLQGTPTYTSSTHFAFNAGDYIDTNQSLSSENFSVGAWFRTNFGGVKMILSKETNAGWPWNYRIWMNGGQIYGDIATLDSSNSVVSPLTNYNNNSWYYVMFTRDSSKLRLYVNGVEVNNSNATLSSITNSQEVWLGLSAYLGGSYQWNGDISQVFIYNRTLTASEILQNYNATKLTYGL